MSSSKLEEEASAIVITSDDTWVTLIKFLLQKISQIRPLQVGFLFLVSNFPKSGEGKREIRNLETFLLPVSGQPVIRPTMHTAVH